ncbi:MAG: hypothetical protein ACTSUT_04010 [Promethearchaeota archaeon]
MISNRTISLTEEKRIVTGLITSSDFIKQILPVFQLDYFVNSYLKIIAEWCVVFYEEHERNPYFHIQDIYESQAPFLKETESELIGDLLKLLSDQYDSESVNVGYLTTSAIDYFRKRELEITVNNVSALKEKGEYDAAEDEIAKFSKISLDLDSGSLINIGNIEQVSAIYKQRDEEDKNFYSLAGDLGRYLGNFKRGDVIGYYAPAKRGKSWTLVDHFKHGILQKKKTLFWSIEMTKTEILPRIMKSFIPMVDEGGEYQFPVFDCIKNQTGECGDRLSGVIIKDGDDIFPDPTHIPCTKCKEYGHGLHDFDMTIYMDTIYRQADDIFTVQEFLSGSKRAPGTSEMFNKYGRLSVHSKYSLTYDKMMRDIEILNTKDGFIPDIFIIDYIDILDIGSKFDDYRSVDEAWKLLARMAGEFNVLVVTATQANKEGHKAEVLDATHQAGFYGKNQHVNEMIGINQTSAEKEMGIIKYGITEARSQHFIPGKTCTVLTDLKAGQTYLDSYYKF